MTILGYLPPLIDDNGDVLVDVSQSTLVFRVICSFVVWISWRRVAM